MADRSATLDEIHRLAEALDAESVPYVFIGGVAMNAWAVPRGTFDLDVVLSVPEDALRRLLAAMEARGWVVDPVFVSGFRDRLSGMEKIHVQLPVQTTLLTADIFLAHDPYLKSVLERRVLSDTGAGRIWVCTAADVVLLKLVASRRKDLLDVENILQVQGIPERDYLERWADQLGIRKRLEQAFAELEGGPEPG